MRLQISVTIIDVMSVIYNTNDLYQLSHRLSCAHEQKARWACIMHWWALSIGVASVANKKALFVTLLDHNPQFDAHWSQFFAEFNWFVVLASRLDACISRYGNFCANDDTTDYFSPCAWARGNDVTTVAFSDSDLNLFADDVLYCVIKNPADFDQCAIDTNSVSSYISG